MNTEKADAQFGGLKRAVEDVQAVNRRVIATLVRLEGKVDDMAERMATKDDISALNKRMDKFGGLREDMRLRWAVHADALVEHDKRLKKLDLLDDIMRTLNSLEEDRLRRLERNAKPS